jgi:hypothetical protein
LAGGSAAAAGVAMAVGSIDSKRAVKKDRINLLSAFSR